jgi:hypothetical protein
MFALGAAGFELKLVSSIALARTREALHNNWDKNDPKDAQVILRMLEIGAVQVFHDPLVAGICDIQELSKTYEMVTRAQFCSKVAVRTGPPSNLRWAQGVLLGFLLEEFEGLFILTHAAAHPDRR